MPKKIIIIDDRNDTVKRSVQITYKEIEAMAGIGLTQEQICTIKGIHANTFTIKKKNSKIIKGAIDSGKAKDLFRLLKKLRGLTDTTKETPEAVQLQAIKTLLNIIHGLNEKNTLEHVGELNVIIPDSIK